MALVDVSRFLPSRKNAVAVAEAPPPPVPVDTSNMIEDMRAVYKERELCREAGDVQGEAGALLTVAEMHANDGSYAEAISKAKEATELCRVVGEREGHASALQMSVQLHLADKRHEEALDLAEQALHVLQKLEDKFGEANVDMLIAQAHLQLAESDTLYSEAEEKASWQARQRSCTAAGKAVKLARDLDDLELLCSALCMQSQASCAALKGADAVAAANEALLLYRSVGDRPGEAYAHCLSANAFVAKRQMKQAYDAASKGLLMFRRLGDEWGQSLAEAALDAIEGKKQEPATTEADLAFLDDGDIEDHGPVAVEGMSEEAAHEMRKTVRGTVIEIVGMDDDLADDTPLMNLGLTSQQAVLLRNSLQKNLPGPNLPFTMMFDHPNIGSLTEFFQNRASK